MYSCYFKIIIFDRVHSVNDGRVYEERGILILQLNLFDSPKHFHCSGTSFCVGHSRGDKLSSKVLGNIFLRFWEISEGLKDNTYHCTKGLFCRIVRKVKN